MVIVEVSNALLRAKGVDVQVLSELIKLDSLDFLLNRMLQDSYRAFEHDLFL